MRERRINRSHDASGIGSIASSKERYISTTEYITNQRYILDMVNMNSLLGTTARAAVNTYSQQCGILQSAFHQFFKTTLDIGICALPSLCRLFVFQT
jgi:hypothetical protein